MSGSGVAVIPRSRTGVVRVGRPWTWLVVGIVSCAALAAVPASAQTIVSNDFEDGTLQGWTPRGATVVLASTVEAAHAGARSLKTTGRTAGFHGPSLNALGLLTSGATYQVSVWVRLVAADATQPTIRVTMQRTVSGTNNFDTIASNGTVTAAGWTQLTGLYAFAGNDPGGLLLYVESTNATTAYYIDDFRIDKIADPPGPPPNTNGLVTTFESGTTEGWTPRIGPEIVAASTAEAHTGSYSLLTTNRTSAFRGPNFDVTNVMFNGSRYKVSLWVKLAPGEAPAQVRVSLQRNAGSITTFHTVIGNTNVTDGAWVRLTTTYSVALANSSLALYVETASSTAPFPSFYIDDVQITYVPPQTIEPDLPSVYQSLAAFFPVGAGGVGALEISGVHGDLLKKHFNSLTSGNDMKWDATEPNPGAFTFTNADQQVAFAVANGMRVRGHTLLWHNQTPAWVFTDPATGTTMQPTPANHDLLLERLASHIRGVVPHFGDKVYAWDVVNEVIDEGQPDCMRRSTWFNVTGKDFLDTAFRTAREVAAPGTLLFINDYNTTIPAKRMCLYNLVTELRARGVPVDGVGHQMHDNLEFPSVPDLEATLDLFATVGVTQHVTEMDVSIYTGSNNTAIANYDEIPPDRFLTQARHYRDFFEVFRAHRDQLTSVTLWGLADDNSWLTTSGRVNAPLLFDDQLTHKLAYTGVVNPEALPRTPAIVTLSTPAAIYDGGLHAASATTTPPGLAVEIRYNGSTTPPVNAGTYVVEAVITNRDYEGFATGTLVIAKAMAAVGFVDLSLPYDGTPRAVTVDTLPAGLAVVVEYDGGATPPTAPGSYTVTATVQDANYVGSAAGTLVVAATAVVRHAPSINGRVEGSVEVLLPESATLNGGVVITGDLLVPGTPNVRLNGSPDYQGTLDGGGSATPAGHTVTLNGGARLRHVVRRTNAVAFPVVPAPPRPTGTRDVALNVAGQSPGNFATLRNLTLNGGAGAVSVPPGTYGAFTVNGNASLVLGVAGATEVSVYNLQGLVINGGARVTVVGPVVLNLASGVNVNASVGAAAHPEWLVLNVASGGVTLNGGGMFIGSVVAPTGAVTINATLNGTVTADRLTINGGGVLKANE